MALPDDPFAGFTVGLTDEPTNGFAVTPDDNNDLPVIARRLRIMAAGGGNLAVFLKDQDPGTATPVPFTVTSGDELNYRVRRVLDTGTDVTTLWAFY